MSGVLNAFLSTWASARSTFGEGSPQAGATYDNSATLRQLESGLEGAAPASRWTGSAASAYGTANTEHRLVITRPHAGGGRVAGGHWAPTTRRVGIEGIAFADRGCHRVERRAGMSWPVRAVAHL